jgi:hypothetical protein
MTSNTSIVISESSAVVDASKCTAIGSMASAREFYNPSFGSARGLSITAD